MKYEFKDIRNAEAKLNLLEFKAIIGIKTF